MLDVTSLVFADGLSAGAVLLCIGAVVVYLVVGKHRRSSGGDGVSGGWRGDCDGGGDGGGGD